METGRGAEPAIPPWNAEVVRVTLFTSPNTPLNVKWQDLTGEAPESFEDRAREHIQRSVGSFAAGLLELVVQPIRLDWVLRPPGNPSSGMPTLGPHSAPIETFAAVGGAGLRETPPAN